MSTAVLHCEDCKHCMKVWDPLDHRHRGACTRIFCVVTLVSRSCPEFEPKVPQTPYLGKPCTLLGRPLFTELHLIEEIRLAMHHVETLLKALELQPTIRLQSNPWPEELARRQREG